MSESELMVKKKAWCSSCEQVVSVIEVGNDCPDCGNETGELT